MSEYIEREKAMSFPLANDQYDHVHADPHFIAGCETYKEWLSVIPAADVVEVVRCAECKYAKPWYWDKSRCFLWHETGIDVRNDGYCNYGKRKDGGQDDV